MIDLSVVIVTWNTRDLTCRCLDAVGRALEGASPSSEVFVVDNGSKDGTSEAVRAAFPWAQLIELPQNLGFAAGNNVALDRARGRILLLLNSDALISRTALLECLEALEQHPDVAALGPQLVHANGALQNSVHAFPSALTELLPIALLEWLWPRRFPSKRYPHASPIEVDALLGAAFFVRAEVLAAVGLLSEEYFFYLEETDWCWRMRAAGWRVLHLPSARVEHLSGASSKRCDAALARIEFHRSLYHFLRMRRGAATLGLAVVLRVVRGLLTVAMLAPLSLLSTRQRSRLAERRQLLAWHLRACPDDIGLKTLSSEGEPTR